MTASLPFSALTDEAEQTLQQIRDAGYHVQVVTGEDHWIMFASGGGHQVSVRGDDYLRVVRALAVAVGFTCVDIEAPPEAPSEAAPEDPESPAQG